MEQSVLGFAVTAATVPGKHHLRAGRNNQDAFCWSRVAGGVVAVVCDGCGSGARSELGAEFGARRVARALEQWLARGGSPRDPDLGPAVAADLLGSLDRLAAELGGDRAATIHECLLFTVVAAVWTDEGLATLRAGDGVIVIDDAVETLGPYENDAPPYLAYGLLGGSAELRVHTHDAAARRLLLGTDGLAELRRRELVELGAGERLHANRDALRRRLVLLGRAPGALTDDSTAVAVARRER